MEPSKVVCSDGVSVDNTGPQVISVDIRNARVKPGLIRDKATGEIWLVDKNHYRCKLHTDSYNTSCM